MSNITNSTNVAGGTIATTFGSLLVACCWIALCCGGGYKAKKWYNRRSKRFKYKPAIPVVQGRIIYPPVRAYPPRREMSVVAPARIISPAQTDEYTPDLDERIRDFLSICAANPNRHRDE